MLLGPKVGKLQKKSGRVDETSFNIIPCRRTVYNAIILCRRTIFGRRTHPGESLGNSLMQLNYIMPGNLRCNETGDKCISRSSPEVLAIWNTSFPWLRKHHLLQNIMQENLWPTLAAKSYLYTVQQWNGAHF